MSEADALIAVWHAKYLYGFWRPITAINLADTDGNPATTADPTWTPLLTTPPYPDYASGYSGLTGAFSRALAEVLDTRHLHLTLISTAVPGATRDYDSGDRYATTSSTPGCGSASTSASPTPAVSPSANASRAGPSLTTSAPTTTDLALHPLPAPGRQGRPAAVHSAGRSHRDSTPDLLGAMHLQRLRAGRRSRSIRSVPPFGPGRRRRDHAGVELVCPWCARSGLSRTPGGAGFTGPSAEAAVGVKTSASAPSEASCGAVVLMPADVRSYGVRTLRGRLRRGADSGRPDARDPPPQLGLLRSGRASGRASPPDSSAPLGVAGAR